MTFGEEEALDWSAVSSCVGVTRYVLKDLDMVLRRRCLERRLLIACVSRRAVAMTDLDMRCCCLM